MGEQISERLPDGIINPFSEIFLKEWKLWKDYKWQEFKFKYKGVISEQAALMKLSTLSEGFEDKAVAILRQSMENGWKGMFVLSNQNNSNGKQQSATETRKDVNTVLSGRNYQ